MKKRIVLVDDEPAVVGAVKTIPEAEEYDIVEAYSGNECLSKLEK